MLHFGQIPQTLDLAGAHRVITFSFLEGNHLVADRAETLYLAGVMLLVKAPVVPAAATSPSNNRLDEILFHFPLPLSECIPVWSFV